MNQLIIQQFKYKDIVKQLVRLLILIKEIVIALLLILAFVMVVAMAMSFDVKAKQLKTNAIAEQLKATFSQTTFDNLEPSPISGLWQAEISNQVVYFSPKQELMIFGEIYTKNGNSLSDKTRQKWQSKKMANLDLSSALMIGDGLIEIIEFTDTDCPFCQRFGEWLERKNSEYKTQNGKDLFTRRVIMTPIASLHPNAHKEAVHVLCIAKNDKSNAKAAQALADVLKGTISYADMMTCDEGKAQLKQHEVIAKSFGVSATPTIIIDGEIIQGFNQAKLEQIIKARLNQE